MRVWHGPHSPQAGGPDSRPIFEALRRLWDGEFRPTNERRQTRHLALFAVQASWYPRRRQVSITSCRRSASAAAAASASDRCGLSSSFMGP
jgi:hypothetical protein